MGKIKKHKRKRAEVIKPAVSKRWLDSSADVAGRPRTKSYNFKRNFPANICFQLFV